MAMNRIDADTAIAGLEAAGACVERDGNILSIRVSANSMPWILYIEKESVYQPGYKRVLNKLLHH